MNILRIIDEIEQSVEDGQIFFGPILMENRARYARDFVASSRLMEKIKMD